MPECELCGYQSADETEFKRVVAGMDGGIMTWEELWCNSCVAENNAEEVTPDHITE